MSNVNQQLREALLEQHDQLELVGDQAQEKIQAEFRALEKRRKEDAASYERIDALQESYHNAKCKMLTVRQRLRDLTDPLPLSFTPEEE